MPTKTEREYYRMGFLDGMLHEKGETPYRESMRDGPISRISGEPIRRPGGRVKRKLSAWNKFVKANSKKPRFVLRSGKLNLKKMAIAFRRQKKR